LAGAGLVAALLVVSVGGLASPSHPMVSRHAKPAAEDRALMDLICVLQF
jgi:hypothetical protein